MKREKLQCAVDALNRHEAARIILGSYRVELQPKCRLLLLGGGHVSRQVCRVASMVGFSVTVADDRRDFLRHEDFPDAEHFLCGDYERVLEQWEMKASDHVCVLTRGHQYDAACIRKLLQGVMPRYTGLISSRRRWEAFSAQLLQEGFTEQQLARIHAPIGLPIGAQSPSEIAVSVCAEMITLRHSEKQGDTAMICEGAEAVLEFLTEGTEKKALLLIVDSTGSVPRKKGTMMAVDAAGNACGTIGGGSGESTAMTEAVRRIALGGAELFSIAMDGDVAAGEGLVCGGTMKIWIEVVE